MATVNLYTFTDIAFTPGTNALQDLGSITNRWKDIYSANALIVTSDFRLKKNITALPYGLKEVLQLRPVRYQWKNSAAKDDSQYLGLIAQEAKKVIPEVVNEGTDAEKTLGIKYSDLVPVLINAIQDQQKIIDAQKIDNETLKSRLEQLESQHTAMLNDLDQIKKAVGMEASNKKK